MSSDHAHHHTSHEPSCHVAEGGHAGPAKPTPVSHHAHHSHAGAGPISTSFQATLHCLTGCVIGEVIGLAIGVSLGFEPIYTIILATTLAYISGFTLGVLPVMKSQGLRFWPAFKGRDGCRTPMVWEAAKDFAGFSTVKPWLPVSESHRALAADRQAGDPASLLSHYRQLLAWRRGVPALIHGDMTLLPVHPQVLAFVREHEGARVLCAFNLSDEAAEVVLDAAGVVRFQPWDVLFARLS